MIGRVPDGSVDEPRVILYHSCAISATGSVMGPHDALAYWWADSGGVRLVPAGPMEEPRRRILEQAIYEALGILSPAEAVRERQDRLGEAVDL